MHIVVLQVRASKLRAIFVFIAPPSLQELEQRLRGRATESEEQVQNRLAHARKEIQRSVDCLLKRSPHKVHIKSSLQQLALLEQLKAAFDA